MGQEELINKIKILKQEKNALILAHNYQREEIYDVADYIGDSLELARAAQKTDADIIVFCGVDFMAESAAILNPKKKVLIPDRNANCPMSEMVNPKELIELKKKHPNAKTVCYVNTSADVKAECDVCCTSANAIKVVNSIKEDEIIFVPDKNLGLYVQSNSEKKIINWEGFCYVHNDINAEFIKVAEEKHPNALVVAHPECKPKVIELADNVASTSGMIKFAKESDAKEFIICTESGMVGKLQRDIPEKKFYSSGKICFNMKKITLEKVYESLVKEQFIVTVSDDIAKKAKKALNKMLEVC